MTRQVTIFCLCLLPISILPESSGSDQARAGNAHLAYAAQYLREFGKLCTEDGGGLWGASLAIFEGLAEYTGMRLAGFSAEQVVKSVTAKQADETGFVLLPISADLSTGFFWVRPERDGARRQAGKVT